MIPAGSEGDIAGAPVASTREPAFTRREIAAATALAALEGKAGSPAAEHLSAARAALVAADAIAPVPAAASMHMDGIDASREVWAFVERTAEELPPHPAREIQLFNHERGDGSTVLFWHAGRLAAAGIVARDTANWSAALVWRVPIER